MFSIGDYVKIARFDDGNQKYRYAAVNRWIVTDFKFNKSKTIIQNIDKNIKAISISTWKLMNDKF